MTRLSKILYRRDLPMGDQSINPYKTIFNTFNNILNMTNLFYPVLVGGCRCLIGNGLGFRIRLGFGIRDQLLLDSLGYFLIAWDPYY